MNRILLCPTCGQYHGYSRVAYEQNGVTYDVYRYDDSLHESIEDAGLVDLITDDERADAINLSNGLADMVVGVVGYFNENT